MQLAPATQHLIGVRAALEDRVKELDLITRLLETSFAALQVLHTGQGHDDAALSRAVVEARSAAEAWLQAPGNGSQLRKMHAACLDLATRVDRARAAEA